MVNNKNSHGDVTSSMNIMLMVHLCFNYQEFSQPKSLLSRIVDFDTAAALHAILGHLSNMNSILVILFSRKQIKALKPFCMC